MPYWNAPWGSPQKKPAAADTRPAATRRGRGPQKKPAAADTRSTATRRGRGGEPQTLSKRQRRGTPTAPATPATPAAPDGAEPTTASVDTPGTDNVTMNVPPDNAMAVAMAVAMIIPPDNAMAMWNDGLYAMRKTGPFLSLDIEDGGVIEVAD